MTDSTWTKRLGSVSYWAGAPSLSGHLAAAVERLGYGAIWIGGSPGGDLRIVEELLEATSTITIATGIVNIWKDAPALIAADYHRIEGRYPGRFLAASTSWTPPVCRSSAESSPPWATRSCDCPPTAPPAPTLT